MLPPIFKHWAGDIISAAQRIIKHTPAWIAPRIGHWNKGTNFRQLELIELAVTKEALEYLRRHVQFQSILRLHDRFWVQPPPEPQYLIDTHRHLTTKFARRPVSD